MAAECSRTGTSLCARPFGPTKLGLPGVTAVARISLLPGSRPMMEIEELPVDTIDCVALSDCKVHIARRIEHDRLGTI